MEFTNRGAMQPAAARNTGEMPSSGSKRGGRWKDGPTWMRIAWVVLLSSVAVIVLAVAIFLYVGGPKESKQVLADRQQAVFLTNGQVYFGKIKSINNKFIDLRGIYYLNVSQQSDTKTDPNQRPAQSSISLVKLGCELHGPADQMLINRDQVTFWENLKSDGQVSKAIAKWVEQNPNGQKCQIPAANDNNTNSSN